MSEANLSVSRGFGTVIKKRTEDRSQMIDDRSQRSDVRSKKPEDG